MREHERMRERERHERATESESVAGKAKGQEWYSACVLLRRLLLAATSLLPDPVRFLRVSSTTDPDCWRST